ncbi:NAD(+) synthase [Leptospira interrogans]|uniref:Glutamine-dependent NAD(+) synthetase n=1 Tax=Leptospira interrogans serovar Lora str. TE 1992 TaxID=1193028 RepID=M3DST5_LEPIR|nr:NAD(+) synthase [Leptospira interrogans]EMF44233.1 NAD+ synthetase [Leptospira interrogans serovar Lora str. TE 1992]AKH77891.1 NAD(+) synthase [Leptospira interrogans serovar Bratislava]EMN10140.1 NAD+ synthetase [Leptospira interrogans serovar Muenchen str. Brem 129]KLO75385.1 NAD+ synthetase [Leptospira interrogans serovar Muenchen]KWV24270.1 NH(3)-dependent NAD(+) synthetase [Leptospira interrogans]
MQSVRLTSVSLKTKVFDFQGNLEKIKRVLELEKKSDLILFPELCISGYGCEDAFYFPRIWKKSWNSLIQLLPHTENKIIVVGLPIFQNPYLFNCAAVLCNGVVAGIVPKSNLASTGVHYENRWFTRGEESQENFIAPDGSTIPFGSLIFETDHFSFGVEICEDSWVLQKPSIPLAEAGTDLILSPGASHFAFGKQRIRRQIFQESSRRESNVYLFSNLCGNESGRLIFEGGSMIVQNGKLLSESERLFFGDFSLCSNEIDFEASQADRAKNFRPSGNRFSKTKSTEENKIYLGIEFPKRAPKVNKSLLEISVSKEEESYLDFTKAVALGLFDYLMYSNTKGYTLSLSGGADSSACALLVTAMKKIAKLELGENFFKSKGIPEESILCTLYQSTSNNSDRTKFLAKSLAKEIQSIHGDLTIDSEIQSISEKISKLTGISLRWDEHNLTLQNIQARVRSPIIWMLANLNGHLLLSTGNRSEASVGYTTMDGDSSGSIAPLTGVSKEFILKWLRFVSEGKDPILPAYPSIKEIVNSPPSAELKPPEDKQEDEKDLMPYPLLQKIEELFIVRGAGYSEIIQLLSEDSEIQNLPPKFLEESVKKYISLFHKNQWKRERLPPSFHLDDYGLDPKSSFRFPILSEDIEL